MKRFVMAVATAIGLSVAAGQAYATVEVLNFAGLNGENEEEPLNYYNGGLGSQGSGPGPNFGITFPANVISCNGQPGGTCNVGEIPGGPGAQIIFLLSGANDTMNVAGGFTTGFSFDYSTINDPGFVTVWSGLNNTGTMLAMINLPTTPNDGDPGCDGANFCPFTAIGVNFAGTAMSVDFAGTANQVAFADITLGSATAGGGGGGPIPEPASMAVLGMGLLGLGAIRFARR